MMIQNAVFSHTAMPAIEKGLDANTLRGKAIANNLANVLTPDYQRIEVSFEDELSKALNPDLLKGELTQAGHMKLGRPDIDDVQPVAFRPDDPSRVGDINNVDIDIETAKLASTQLSYFAEIRAAKYTMDAVIAAAKGTAH